MGDSRRLNSGHGHEPLPVLACANANNNSSNGNQSVQQLLAELPPVTRNIGRGKRLTHHVNHHSTPKCKMKKGTATAAAAAAALSSSASSASPNIPSPNSSITIVNSNSQNNSSNTNTASTNASKTTGGTGTGRTAAVAAPVLNSHHYIHSHHNHESPSHQQHQHHHSSHNHVQQQPYSANSFYDNSNSIYTITPNKTPTTMTNSSNSGNENQLMNDGSGSAGNCSETAAAAMDVQEFLPVCDALFNVISLAIYFCDIVFDILSAYSFYTNDGLPQWALICFVFILSSVILSQLLSYRLYAVNEKKHGHQLPCSSSILLLTHFLGCGVLWRYFKLFIPLDMKLVKNKVRDLLLLRLVHGFIESAPMLFIQLYLILGKDSWSKVSDLNIVSTSFSLLSLCWALASFSKNIRQINVHKLMLTWLGLIFQFLWRLGTITSRILTLTLYTTVYHYWIFLVLTMHWLSMFAWIVSPSFRIFANEKMTRGKKYCYSALLAVVYIFCYVNILESNSRVKMLIYYVTMILEDCLLLSVWYIAIRFEEPAAAAATSTAAGILVTTTNNTTRWYDEYKIMGLIIGSFCVGLIFMGLYYRFFHITKLNYGLNTSNYDTTTATGATKLRGGGCDETRSSSLMNGNFESSPTSYMSSGSVSASVVVSSASAANAKDNKLTFESCSCSHPRNVANINNNNNNNNHTNKDNKFEFSDGDCGGVTVTNHTLSNNACNNNGNHNSSFHGGPHPPSLHYCNNGGGNNSKRPAPACSSGMGNHVGRLGRGNVTGEEMTVGGGGVGGKKSKYSNGNSHSNGNGNVCNNNINGFANAPVTNNNVQVQGVFNCRFNPAMKRKKKKPTSFVPPPNLGNCNTAAMESEIIAQQPKVMTVPHPHPAPAHHVFYNDNIPSPPGNKLTNGGKMSHPFWKRPLSTTNTNPNESQSPSEHIENIESVSMIQVPITSTSTCDIQQKIYEKKQQQLADLRKIEQEIKQQAGGLSNGLLEPSYMHISSTNSDHDHFNILHRHNHNHTPQQEKRRPWFSADSNSPCQSSPRPANEEILYDSRFVDSFQPHNNHSHNSRSSHTQQHHHDNGDDVLGHGNYEDCCNPQGDNDWPQFDPSYNYDPYALDDDDLPDQYHNNRNLDHDEYQVGEQSLDHVHVHVHGNPEFEDEHTARNISGARRRLLRKSAGKTNAPRLPTSSHSQSALDLVGSSTASYPNQHETPPTPAERLIVRMNGSGNGNKTGRHPHQCQNQSQSQGHLHSSSALASTGAGASNGATNGKQVLYKSCRRIPSDIESQLSLSRSYTLPQEFKYRRKFSRTGMNVKNEQQLLAGTTTLPSTNSSDGDVDSVEDETEIYGHLQKIPLPVPSVHHLHIPNQSRDGSGTTPSSSSPATAPGGPYSYASPRKPEHETKL